MRDGQVEDMTPGFYRQEAALECLPIEIQGRASAESPLAQGLAYLKSSAISLVPNVQ